MVDFIGVSIEDRIMQANRSPCRLKPSCAAWRAGPRLRLAVRPEPARLTDLLNAEVLSSTASAPLAVASSTLHNLGQRPPGASGSAVRPGPWSLEEAAAAAALGAAPALGGGGGMDSGDGGDDGGRVPRDCAGRTIRADRDRLVGGRGLDFLGWDGPWSVGRSGAVGRGIRGRTRADLAAQAARLLTAGWSCETARRMGTSARCRAAGTAGARWTAAGSGRRRTTTAVVPPRRACVPGLGPGCNRRQPWGQRPVVMPR